MTTTKKKNVTSKDPRKKAITAALKIASGATCVTLVKETGVNRFSAHCFTRYKSQSDPGESFGKWEVEFAYGDVEFADPAGLPASWRAQQLSKKAVR